MKIRGNWLYGNEVSEYGKENGYVDYRTLAKCFDAVLNNDIIPNTENAGLGYWDQVSGGADYSDEIDELQEQVDELQEQVDALEDEQADTEDEEREKTLQEQIDEKQEKQGKLQDKIDELQNEMDYPPEVFQFYIVSDNGAELLQEAGEIVYYNETLDMYVWGVTHWGTSWDYVLTNIKIDPDME